MPTRSAPVVPVDLSSGMDHWNLADVVDIALRNSPETRVAWSEARAAAAEYRSRQGDYYPKLDLTGELSYAKGSAVGGRFSFEQTTYGPLAELTCLLFNFGARKAQVEEARQALSAANWTHNAAIQRMVLVVEQSYFQYVESRAMLKAEEASLQEARTSLDAAEERHKAGVATVADVLQARTAVSQAQLTLESIRGRIYATRGLLATAMGLPANTLFDVDLQPEAMPTRAVSEEVDRYIGEAQRKRPDLAAARAAALQAGAHLRAVRRELFPSLLAGGSAGRDYYDETGEHSDSYAAALTMKVPLFRGFSRIYDIRKAEAQAEATSSRLESLEQEATLQVWTSYYSLKTAEQQVKASEDLLESARQSRDVALGRYKAGVGSILDLLSAQSVLEGARAQNVGARTEWFLSLAKLAYDTGSLWLEEGLAGAGAPGGPPGK